MRNSMLTIPCPLSDSGDCATEFLLSIAPPEPEVGIMGYQIEEISPARCKCKHECEHACNHLRALWAEMATGSYGPLERKLYDAMDDAMEAQYGD